MDGPSYIIIATGLGIWAAVSGLFWKLEEIVSPAAKASISSWLNRVDTFSKVNQLPHQFSYIFDRVFGEKHLTLKCFLRSSLASLLSVSAVLAIWGALSEKFFFTASLSLLHLSGFLFFWLAAISFNLLPDYISLLETRYLIGIMERARSLTAILLLFLVDLLISLSIIVLFLEALTLAYYGKYYFIWSELSIASVRNFFREYFLMGVQRGIMLDPDGAVAELAPWMSAGEAQTVVARHSIGLPPFGVFLYSSLFTSIWAWLYFSSSTLVRCYQILSPGLSYLKYFLDIDKYPLRSIGAVAGGLACFGYWALVAVAWFL